MDALKFFKYDHLPLHLQMISKPFHDLASDMLSRLPDNRERQKFLDKLIEAKDCAVRANIP